MLERIGVALGRRRTLEPWTLAEIAPAAGLSPAGLIKRFGSRRGILESLSLRWIDSIATIPLGVDPPEVELRSWVERRFADGGPESVARGLVNLVDDLVDDRLRGLLAEGWEKEIRYLGALLAATGRLKLADPERAAAFLFDALNGAMLRGAVGIGSASSGRVLDDFLETFG